MSEKDEPNPFFKDEKLDKDKLFVELPVEQKPVEHERIPSGFDPMGEINIRGRAARSLAGGRIRWWVLLSGWIIFGGFALLILYAAVISLDLAALMPLAFVAIPLLILWRGTVAKLSSRKYRGR